jgi:N-acetylglucosamine malate deacetylase 1
MTGSLNVLAVFAHPDDTEFLCAGTLAHLARLGAQIHIVTMTAGDCGSQQLPPRRIAALRRKEARQSASLIHADYRCLQEKDLCVFYDGPTLRKVMGAVRRARPDIVFTHSPVDYMVDHETTSRLCQTACFGALAPNFRTVARPPAKPLDRVPHLYYTQAFGGRDILGRTLESGIFVDISVTLAQKENMLACHKSQQSWLRAQQGVSGPVAMMRTMARHAGRRAKLMWAEGFNQHLGQGFPKDNLLAKLMGRRARRKKYS